MVYSILDGKGRDVPQTLKAIRSGLVNTGRIEVVSDLDVLASISFDPQKIEITADFGPIESETFGHNQLDFCVNKFAQIVSTITRPKS